MDHNSLTYETIYSASQHVERQKSLIQEFWVTLLYIKGEDNVVANDFTRINMAHHTHKIVDTTL